MIDRRAEDDSLAIACLFFPVRDDGICHRRLVHDRVHLAHIKVGRHTTHLLKRILHADINDKGAGLHEMPGGDQLGNPDLIGDIVEDLAQTLSVAAIGCGGNTKNLCRWVTLQRLIDDAPVAVGDRVMCLIDDEEIEYRHFCEVRCA